MTDFFAQYGTWIWVGVLALVVLLILFNYRKVPPNVALVISGGIRRRYKVKDENGQITVKKFGYRIVRGGATLVIPFFERVDKLNLGIMQVDIRTTQPVPSQEYISVIVDGVANIKIASDDISIATAAEQFLNWKSENIAAIAQQVLEGNMREIIGRMTIADLVQNRDKFATETSRAATADMANMGLEIINITIQNFEDKEGVVETMATKNIVEKERDAQIAKAEAEQQGHKASVEANALMAEQSKDLELKQAEFKVQADRAKADADIAYNIQQEIARKSFEQERADAEMVKLQKQTELERQQVEIQRQKLNVEIREKAEAERDARIAQAEADKAELQAKADAEYYAAQKQAEAILLKGKAEAEALELKATAMQKYGEAAMLEMVVDKLPEVARAIGEPLAQTDKILMFGEGAATGLTRDITGSMMQTFEAMKGAIGMDVPKMLKDISTGGLVGRAQNTASSAEAALAQESAPAEP
ncbi:MAG: SPFH domain-containing protein [Eubacteriales bacterium]|nr:SPFH domain-containing protein [Eubacteriales bacterium]